MIMMMMIIIIIEIMFWTKKKETNDHFLKLYIFKAYQSLQIPSDPEDTHILWQFFKTFFCKFARRVQDFTQ